MHQLINTDTEMKHILDQLEDKLKKLEMWIEKPIAYSAPNFCQWKQEVEVILRRAFGPDSTQLTDFATTTNVKVSYYGVVFRPSADGKLHPSTNPEVEAQRRFIKMLPVAEAKLKAIIFEIENFGVSNTNQPTTPSKAFIAHGNETIALDKLRSFLDVLGIYPVIAEDEPSKDRSINEQVEWCLDNADCAIILGTADDKELEDGKLYPRRNVHIEIGRVQERFPGRVIYLLEEGASFPSNISEKVYERFTQENMEKAFLKTAKELKAFGIIRATCIGRQVG